MAKGLTPRAEDYSRWYGDVIAQTPELDSLALFGTGALGMASYALTRFRARRRR